MATKCSESDGIVYPPDKKNSEPNKRSTTVVAKQIFTAALQAAATPTTTGVTYLPLPPDKQWRYGYKPTVMGVATEMASNPVNPLQMARAGLQAAHTLFNFRRRGCEEMPLTQACKEHTFTGSYVTGSSDQQSKSKLLFSGVPYQGKEYRDKELVKLVQRFAKEGQAEPSFAASIEEVVLSETLVGDTGLRQHVFILIGATSEMGPTQTLLDLGATIVALARPASKRAPKKWSNLLQRANASPGTMLFPTKSADGSIVTAGCDALTDTPEIINWLVELYRSHPLVQGKRLHVYSGIYLDGGKFVRASVAMEMILSELTLRLPPNNPPALLYIDTPSHAHVVKRGTYEGGVEQRASSPYLMRAGALCGLFRTTKSILSPGGRESFVVMDFLGALLTLSTPASLKLPVTCFITFSTRNAHSLSLTHSHSLTHFSHSRI